MTASRDELLALLRLVDITNAEEVACSEFLDRVAGLVERAGPDGQPADGEVDLVHHLRMCPECLEEYEALYRLLCEEKNAR